MHRPRHLARFVASVASLAVALLAAQYALRATAVDVAVEAPRVLAGDTATDASEPAPAIVVERPRAERVDTAPRPTAATLLAEAADARQQGDLRATLALLQDAVATEPGVETHAALGTLYFELGAARAAEPNLRAAAEGDPGNADRWIALANALALKPDPMAAAGALQRARDVEPGLRVTRDDGGRIVRVRLP